MSASTKKAGEELLDGSTIVSELSGLELHPIYSYISQRPAKNTPSSVHKMQHLKEWSYFVQCTFLAAGWTRLSMQNVHLQVTHSSALYPLVSIAVCDIVLEEVFIPWFLQHNLHSNSNKRSYGFPSRSRCEAQIQTAIHVHYLGGSILPEHSI